MTSSNSRTLIASAVSMALSSMMLSAGLSAGEIQVIDLKNFGEYDPGLGEFVTIYDRDATDPDAVSYGEIGWDILKAETPGIIVFNNTPIYGNPAQQIIADCVMAPRIDALLIPQPDGSFLDKQCNDTFQTHKRYKMSANAIGPIDMVFTVKNVDAVATIYDKDGNVVATDQDVTRNVYRMIGKLNNHTGGAMGGFTVQLGVGLGDNFRKSPKGDGLKISLLEEGAVDGALTDNDMAEFPGGLFYGPADDKHGIGFFSDTRAGFTVDTAAFAVEEDFFGSITPTANYFDKFGKWLPIDGVPQGWFYDFDGNPATDATLVAWDSGANFTEWTDDQNWQLSFSEGFAPVNPVTEGWVNNTATVWIDDGNMETTLDGILFATWNPTIGLYDLAADGTMTNDEMTLLIAANAATYERRSGYFKGPIEDLANLNLNYYIEVGDISTLPSYNSADQTATFTLRITSLAENEAELPPPAEEFTPLPPPVTDNDDGGGCTIGNSNRFDPLFPALVAMGLGYFGLRRFKASK